MDTYTKVRERLLSLCKEKGMNVNNLAVRAELPPSTVKNIIYGKSKNPGVVTLKMLCDGLGVTLSEFFETSDFNNCDN